MTIDFSLTPQQINTFQTFGYMKFPGLFADVIQDYSNKFDELYERDKDEVISWQHEAHYNKNRQILMQIMERDTDFCKLIDDPRIDGIFSSLLGDDYLYRTSEGNIFSSGTYWHTDLYNIDFKYQHLKMIFYLDPVEEHSGCFRTIPGSHHWGDKFSKLLERDIYKPEENYGLSAEEIPGQIIPTQPGDLLIFDYRLKHATCDTGSTRRMFTIAASERFADEDLSSLAKLIGELKEYTGTIYQQTLIDSASPKRMTHLEQSLSCESLLKSS